MNKESDINGGFLFLDIMIWKKKYIEKQYIKNPNITKQELIKKIKKAKYSKFRKKAFELLNNRINNQIEFINKKS